MFNLFKKKDNRSQRAIVLETLQNSTIPMSSSYFVYELGIPRISEIIRLLREEDLRIYTLKKENLGKRKRGGSVKFYFLCRDFKDELRVMESAKRGEWSVYYGY